MDDVILHGMDSLNDITNVLSVQRDFQLQGIFHGPYRGQGMNSGADTADALDEDPCVAGITALKNDFNAAPHLA